MTGATSGRVVLATGGTGGHMFPAEALARELITRGRPVTLITDRRGAGFGADLPEVETCRIQAGGIAGGSVVRRVKGVLSLGIGFFQARKLLKRLDADVVVGFGGYPSVPTVLAGSLLGLRIVLHEQNAVLGRANRLLAPRAQAIGTCFDTVLGLRGGDRHKVTVTGNPVRPEIAGLSRQPFTPPEEQGPLRLLVTGGSQGAKAFNDIVPAAVSRLSESLRHRVEVSQQVRGDVQDQVAAIYRSCGVEAKLAAFFDDMPKRLSEAHLAICRAGASTVAELGAAARPAILVPYPYATDDHQTANARALVEAGGGWLMPEPALTPEVLAERIGSLLSTPALLARAAQCAASFARLDAAQGLADLVCGKAGANGGELPDRPERKEAAA